MFALSWFTVLSSVLLFGSVLSAPACELSLSARDGGKKHFVADVPNEPRFVIYSDRFVSGLTGPPPVDQIKVSA